MKLHRVFLIALMTSVFALAGCGDSASDVCDDCENQSDKPLCETAYNQCKDLPNQDECVLGSLALCSVL